VLDDISERKKMEQLRDGRRQYHAHDLKTPLKWHARNYFNVSLTRNINQEYRNCGDGQKECLYHAQHDQ